MADEDRGINHLRFLLRGLWERCICRGFAGRPWGRRGRYPSPLGGSHILLCDGEGVVTVFFPGDDYTAPVRVMSFVRSSEPTALAKEVIDVLATNGFEITE